MAFGQETIEQLYRELAGGRHLSAKLQALLEHPLDSRGQDEAAAVSRELGRVFMVSLYMLKPCSNSSPEEVITRTAPEKRTDDSICLHTPTKVVLQAHVQPRAALRGEEASVTYLNEHTCQAQPVPGQPGTPTTAGSSPTTTTSQRQSSSPELVLDSTMNSAGAPPPAPSLSWPTPAAPEASRPSGVVPAAPAAFVPSAGHSPSAEGSMADEAAAQMDIDYRFQYGPSTFSPVEAAADHRLLIGDCDVPRAARIMDTVWPRYTRDTSAWHR